MVAITQKYKFIALAALLGGLWAVAPGALAADGQVVAGSAAAGAVMPAADAKGFIQGMGNEVIGYIKDESMSPADKKARLAAVLNNNFDMSTISRFTLGKHWKALDAAQQAEYQELFKNMIVSMYAERFATYSGQEFKVAEANMVEDSDTLVMSSIVHPAGDKKDIAINWRVRMKDGQPKIVDVTIQDVSMIITQRSEFDSLIQREGGNPAVILEHLRKRSVTQ